MKVGLFAPWGFELSGFASWVFDRTLFAWWALILVASLHGLLKKLVSFRVSCC
jgi:hypothetical protein